MSFSKPQVGIEPGSLAALQGRCLFYPCAGSDWGPFLEFFGNHVDEFHFCDTGDVNSGDGYEDLRILKSRSPFADPSSYRLITTETDGKPNAQVQQPTAGRPYRWLEPGRLKQVYERVSDGRRLTEGIFAASMIEELAGLLGPKGRNETPQRTDAFGWL